MTTSTHGQPSPLPWLSLPSYWPCDLSAQPCLSFRTELGTFQGGQEGEGSDSVDRGLDPEMDLFSSGSLGWHQGPGIEPREDLGLALTQLAMSSSPANTRTWLPVLRTQAITPQLGNFPLLRMVTEDAQGGGDPLYISCVPTPRY